MGYYCEDLRPLRDAALTVVGSTKLLSESICCTSMPRSQSLKDELTPVTQPAFFIDTIREKSGHALGLMILISIFLKKING